VTFTITNTGAVNATNVSVSLTGDSSRFTLDASACLSTLLPSGTCDVVVGYAPSVVGPHSVNLRVSYGNGVTAVVGTLVTPITGEAYEHHLFIR
jgi:hypothetical protein